MPRITIYSNGIKVMDKELRGKPTIVRNNKDIIIWLDN